MKSWIYFLVFLLVCGNLGRAAIFSRQAPGDLLNQIGENLPSPALPADITNLLPNPDGSNIFNPSSGIVNALMNPSEAGSEQKEVYARQAPIDLLSQLGQNNPNFSMPESLSNLMPKPNGSSFLNPSGISSSLLNPSGAGSEQKEVYARQAPIDLLSQLGQNHPNFSMPESLTNLIPKPNGSSFLNPSGIASGFLNPSGAGSKRKEVYARQAPIDVLSQLGQNHPNFSMPESLSNLMPKPNGSSFLSPSGISSGFLNPSGAGSERKEVYARQAPIDLLSQFGQNHPNFSMPESLSNLMPKPNGSSFLNPSGISSGLLNPSGAGSEQKEVYARQAPIDLLSQLGQNHPNFSMPESLTNLIPKPNGSSFLNPSGIASGFLNPSGAGSKRKEVYARQAPIDVLSQLGQNHPNFSMPESLSNLMPKPNGSSFLNPSGISSGFLNPSGAGSERKEVYARQAPIDLLSQFGQNHPNFSMPESLSNLMPKPNGSSFLNPSGISSGLLNPSGAGSEQKEVYARQAPIDLLSQLGQNHPNFSMPESLTNLIPKPNGSSFLNPSGIASGFLNPSGAGSKRKEVYARQAPIDVLSQLGQNHPNFSMPESLSNLMPKPNGSSFLNPSGISSGFLNPSGAGSERKEVYARQAPIDLLSQFGQNHPNFSMPESLSNLMPKPNGSSFLNPSGISSGLLNPSGAGSEQKEVYARQAPIDLLSQLGQNHPNFSMPESLTNLMPKPNGSSFLNPSGIASGFLNPSGAGSERKELYARQAPLDFLNGIGQTHPNFSLPDSLSNLIPKPNSSSFLNPMGAGSEEMYIREVPTASASKENKLFKRQEPDYFNELTAELSSLFGNSSEDNSDIFSSLMEN